jgi:hypothetical protein
MNSEQNQKINSRQVLSLRVFQELLKNPPVELYNSIGEEGFLEIAKFLSNIPPEDQLNPAAMVKRIGEYCYQSGHEVLKEWYLKTYQSINSEDIQAVVKKTGDPDETADAPSQAKQMLYNEGRDTCKSLQEWASKNQKTPENKHEQQPKS